MESCPVCNNEAAKIEYNCVIDGNVYYFCCSKCKSNFMSEPRKFANCCKEEESHENNK